MADFYLDPEGGNDANNGTTFALRKKTIAAFTSGIVSAGDRIKVMASYDPTTPGSATWTDGSLSVTPGAAFVKDVQNCDAAWTGGTGVTATTSTAGRKEGTNRANLSVASATVTGAQKIAYAATAANLDLSAYQAISLWFGISGGTWTDSTLVLDLCSDATGDVAVATLPLGVFAGVTGMVRRLLEYGGNLPSGINSIAIRSTAKPLVSGTNALWMDNIVAVKARGDAGHICHRALIGKNTVGEPEWYAIMSLTEALIELGNDSASKTSPARNYRGTTESVALYVRDTIYTGMSAAERAVAVGGTSVTTPITISGGWDRTAMSTQSGETWWTGGAYATYAIEAATSANTHLVFEGIGTAHFSLAGLNLGGSFNKGSLQVRMPGSVSCAPVNLTPSSLTVFARSLDLGNIMQDMGNLGVVYAAAKIRARRISGATGFTLEATSAARPRNRVDMRIDQIDNCATGLTGSFDTYLRGTTFKWNTTDVAQSQGGIVHLDNCSFPEGIKTAPDATKEVISTATNGDAWDVRRYGGHYTVITDAAVFRTAGYRSVKISISNADAFHSYMPFLHPLLKVAGKAGVTINFEAYVRRNNTGLSAGITTLDGYVDGVGVTSQSLTGAANIWEHLTLSVTPTKDGLVELYAFAYGGTTYDAWFTEAKFT